VASASARPTYRGTRKAANTRWAHDPALELPSFEAAERLDRLLQETDGLGVIALLEVRVAEGADESLRLAGSEARVRPASSGDEGAALRRLIGLQWSRPGGERTRFFTFEIVIEREAEDEGYSAYSPTLPGCFSNGKTIEEAKRHIREAIQQHVEALLAHGQPVPQNDRLVHVQELTVGIP